MKYILLILALILGIYLGGKYVPRIHQPDISGIRVSTEEEVKQKLNRHKKILAVNKYFKSLPAKEYSGDIVDAAETYLVDYRVLCVIAYLESSGFRNDSCQDRGAFNGFGFDSNNTCFKDARESIFNVAEQLSNSYHYKGKNIKRQLCVWNEGLDYENCPYANKALIEMEKI